MTSHSQFQCPYCFNWYKRKEHLLRHLTSHGANRPYQCESCTSSFKRADVLKRHLRTCILRLGNHVVAKQLVDNPNMNKKRACDRCAKQKRACDRETPCQGCLRTNSSCVYSQSLPQLEMDGLFPAEIGQCNETLNPEADSQHDQALIEDTFLTGAQGSSMDIAPMLNQEAILPEGYPVTTILDGPETLPAEMYDWNALESLTSASPDFRFSSLTWEDYCSLHALSMRNQAQISQPGSTNFSSFKFLANFTSTSGFVSSFDCGTLYQRQQVLHHFFETDGQGDCQDITFDAAGSLNASSSETGNVGVVSGDEEDITHVWGYILPQKHSTETEPVTSHQAQIRPQFTKNWMKDYEKTIQHQRSTKQKALDDFQIANEDSVGRSRLFSDPLALKTHDIVTRVKEAVSSKPRNTLITIGWSSTFEELCVRFFSPPNIRKYLAFYWDFWHPNWPVIHAPTFDPSSVYTVLLAAMIIIGACISPVSSDKDIAREFFDVVEEMAFSDDTFFDHSISGSAPYTTLDASQRRRKVQALQAAYAACLYQNWEGPDRSKRRIRRYRYSTVVAVARDLGIRNATHDLFQLETGADFDWHSFAYREELIRTQIYVFLLDTAFVIFNNLPPRMVVKELKMDLACPESCFRATTAEECFVQVKTWQSNREELTARTGQKKKMKHITLRAVIEMMCQKNLDQNACELLASFGILNLFTMISALHSLIFQCQTSFAYESQLDPIHDALVNWKEVWDRSVAVNPLSTNEVDELSDYDFNLTTSSDETRKRTGFMQNAPEFWLLAKIILDRLKVSQGNEEGKEDDSEEEQMADDIFGDVIGGGGGGSSSGGTGLGQHWGKSQASPTSVLEDYDETSMSQVNKLIHWFQSLNV